MEKFETIITKYSSLLIDLGVGLGILILFFIAAGFLKKTIVKKIKPKSDNPLLAEFIGKIGALALTILGIILFLEIVGLSKFAKHIAAGAGITTFIIGFAFKDIGENFLSGILMAFKSPFKIGDLIETNQTIGYVDKLDLRNTVVKTRDGKDVFIPNSQIIKNPLINYTLDGFLRYDIVIGLDYNSDFEKAKKIIEKCLLENTEILQNEKKPVIIIDELATNTVNLKVLYWIDTFKSRSAIYHLSIKSALIDKILADLSKNNFNLPANIIELKNYANQRLDINT